MNRRGRLYYKEKGGPKATVLITSISSVANYNVKLKLTDPVVFTGWPSRV